MMTMGVGVGSSFDPMHPENTATPIDNSATTQTTRICPKASISMNGLVGFTTRPESELPSVLRLLYRHAEVERPETVAVQLGVFQGTGYHYGPPRVVRLQHNAHRIFLAQRLHAPQERRDDEVHGMYVVVMQYHGKGLKDIPQFLDETARFGRRDGIYTMRHWCNRRTLQTR